MGEIEIGLLKLSDAKQALKVLKKFVSISPVFSKYELDDKRILNTIYHCITNEHHNMWAAKDGDKIVGLMGGHIGSSWFTKEPILREYGLFVEKEYRSKAIGFKLLYEWVKWGKEDFGIKDCWMCLNTGIDPERALKRFKKIGFKQVGVNLRLNMKENNG